MSSRKRDRFFRYLKQSTAQQPSQTPAVLTTTAASSGQSVSSASKQRDDEADEESGPQVNEQAQSKALVLPPTGDLVQPEIASAAVEPKSLWRRAYELVSASDPEILTPFEQLFSAQAGEFQTDHELQAAVEKSLQQRDDKSLVLSVAGKSVHIRQQGEKIIKLIMWSRDWVSLAVMSEPHAAMAWLGVSLLLPLVVRPTEQNTAMIDGLEIITELLSIYKIRLERYFAQGVPNNDFEDSVVQIFAKIIEYQARSVRHLNRGSLNRLGHNIAGSDDWEESLKSIQSKENHIAALAELLDKRAEDAALSAQLKGTSIQIGLQNDMVQLLNDWREEQYQTQMNEREKDCLQMLSSSYREEKDFNRERVTGTCEWFLNAAELADWRNSDGPCALWLSADPGCGKSVLSRCLVDERHLCSSLIGSVICYFFFKEGLEGRRTMSNALAAILHQLFCAEPALITYAIEEYNRHGVQLRNRPLALWDILMNAAKNSTAGEVVVLMDALDECEPNECSGLLNAITRILQDTNSTKTNLKFFMTSRPYTRIEIAMNNMSKSTTYVRVPGEDQLEAIGREIDLVIMADVPNQLPSLSEVQQGEVIGMLKMKKNRTYLWLYLVMDVIREQLATVTTDRELKGLVNKLPSTVSDAYSTILRKSPAPEKAMALLKLVVATRTPLTVKQVRVALAYTNKDCPDVGDLAGIATQSLQTAKSNLKNICGLLLTVSNEQVYLLHETVREFLVDTSLIENGPMNDWQHFRTMDADRTMARVCILVLKTLDEIVPKEVLVRKISKKQHGTVAGLGFKAYKRRSIQCHAIQTHLRTQWPHLTEMIFYALKYWDFHAEHGLALLEPAILRFCYNILEHDCISYILWRYQTRSGYISSRNTPLTLAAMYNQLFIIECLIKSGCDVNEPTEHDTEIEDSRFGNALCAAVHKGHFASVKLLVELGANVNEQRGCWGSPLWHAIRQADIFSYLIESGADINMQGPNGDVLTEAVRGGRPEEVKMCLSHGASNLDSALNAGRDRIESEFQSDLVYVVEPRVGPIRECMSHIENAMAMRKPE